MRLDQIVIHNFRQYYGTQRIHFSKDKTKNVTVIHGENGTGKTALLNAFSWCLYGKIDLPYPDDIINERVQLNLKSNEESIAYVKIHFYNDGRNYTIMRSIKAFKQEDGEIVYFKPVLDVEYIDIDGKTVNPKAAQDLIDQIIPSNMRSYFFFDGERIDKMQDKEKAKEIKNAIKVVMGLEILERSISHLERAKKEFREESAKFGNSEQQEIAQNIDEISDFISKCDDERDQQELNKSALEQEIKEIQSKLRSLEESRELQQKIDQINKEKESVSNKIKEHNKQLKQFLSKKGYLAFTGEFIDRVKDFLDEKREKNQIPTGIKQQFVDDLIAKEECICGRELHPETNAFEKVMGWRAVSSTKALEDAFLDITGDLKFTIQERTRMYEELVNHRKTKDSLKRAYEDLEAEFSEVKGQLEGKDTEEIADLVKSERNKRDTLEEVKDKLKRIELQKQELEKRKEQLEKKFDEIKAENEKSQLAKMRADVSEKVKNAFQEINKIRTKEVQEVLQRRISDVYSKLLRKEFEIELTPNYDIEVYKDFGADRKLVGLSQGERQLTSLSFIGALVDMAREQEEQDNKNESVSMKFGGYYPIVMDSPFGQLDADHQARVAKGLPGLAHQIVIIVSSSQWRGVQDHMISLVGKEFKLEFQSGNTEVIEVK